MERVLRIADRDGGGVLAGASEHRGRVESVNATTLLALVRRGLLARIAPPDGGVGGRLTQAGRDALTQDPTYVMKSHQIEAREEVTVPETRQVQREVIEIWMDRLAKEAQGLDFTDPEDRATFRGQVSASMRGLKWSGMRDLARHLGGGKSDSRDATLRMITTLYMQRARDPHETAFEKKTPRQLDAEIAEALAERKA